MHLRTVTEIGLHLQSFRNIQLWYQGVYFLKFTIYQQKPNNKKVYAQPYAITQTNIVGQQVQRTYDSQIVGLSSIVKNESAFYTKAFHLRYFQQQVEIGDICRWRLQMGTFNKQQNHGIFQQKKGNQNNKQLTIEIGLYFYDSYKKQLNQTINDWRTNSKEVRQMKMKIPVKCMQPQLINSYMPILFTDQYFSLSSSSLHLMTIDYKFRMNQVSLSQFASWSEQERKKKIKEMMMIKRNDVNIQGVNGNNMSRRGGLIVGYMKLKTGAESERKLVENMVEWLKSLQRLSQDIVKQYRRVYEFVMTEDLNLHPKIKHILQPQQVQQSLIHVKQLVKQQQRNLKDRKQVSTRQVNYEDVLMTMFNKISYIGQRNLQVFHDLINLIKLNSIFSIRLYSPQYYQKQKSFYQKLAKFDLINNINHNPSNKQQKRHDITLSNNHHKNKLIKQLQNQRSSIKINTLVYNQKLKTHINQLPLLILQKYTSKTSLENNPSKKINNLTKSGSEFTGIHLIVLVHGFQGTSYDMKLIKNHLSHLYPESMFLCCTSNQDRTDGDLFQMGNRLAVQIKAFILQNFNYNNISTSSTNGLMLSKISFIGHSLGGLKIRAALPKLLEYKNMFQNFITLSSPHLGYNVNTSSVVDAGLWVLQKIKDSQCLRQLKMDDEQNLYDTTLYKLSQQQGLQHFKRVFLFSSSQDSYAPYESARIQIDPQFVDHSDKVKTVHCQMVRNILKNVREQSLHRVDVNFTINTKNLDALIGRTAHILFLQNAEVIKIFSYLYQGIFS